MIGSFLAWLTLVGLVLLVVKSMMFVAGSKPWMRVPNISGINISHLKSVGVQGIIFDADNTLTAYHKGELHPLIADTFHQLASEFKVTVFTNSWSEKRHQQLQRMFPTIPIVNHRHRKPDKAGFIEAAKLLSLHPQQMVMVGDRFTTDIFGGNRVGMKTILVTEPLSDGEEPPWYPVIRWLEYCIFD